MPGIIDTLKLVLMIQNGNKSIDWGVWGKRMRMKRKKRKRKEKEEGRAEGEESS